MSYFDDIISDIQDGKEGKNQGLSTGINTLNTILCGIQKASYYLIGGNTGTGKTAFADACFVLNPIDYMISKNIPLDNFKIRYYSLEISAKRKLTKWTCFRIFKKYRIITDVNEVLSKGRNRISDELYSIVYEQREYIENIQECVTIIDKPINPTGVWMEMKDRFENSGKTDTKTIKYKNGKEYIQKIYKPNNPNRIVLCVVDHVGLIRDEQGFTKKQKIDKLSEYVIELRNRYECSSLLISQFNRELGDINRKRFEELQPQLEDFKDTGNSQEDAEFVMTLFDPMRYNIRNYAGYDISRLMNKVRFWSILKNRDGDANIRIALNFLGKSGYFRSMVKANEMNDQFYNKYYNFTL